MVTHCDLDSYTIGASVPESNVLTVNDQKFVASIVAESVTTLDEIFLARRSG